MAPYFTKSKGIVGRNRDDIRTPPARLRFPEEEPSLSGDVEPATQQNDVEIRASTCRPKQKGFDRICQCVALTLVGVTLVLQGVLFAILFLRAIQAGTLP